MRLIRWEEPPDQPRGLRTGQKPRQPDPYVDLAAMLAANPGRWALIFEGLDGTASGHASRIRYGLTPAWRPPCSFEAVARKRDGVTRVYARYVGSQP